jgi:hypothetical protein
MRHLPNHLPSVRTSSQIRVSNKSNSIHTADIRYEDAQSAYTSAALVRCLNKPPFILSPFLSSWLRQTLHIIMFKVIAFKEVS